MTMMQSDETQQKIDGIIQGHDVVLFMKGTRMFPQCGFSATVVGLLDELVDSYETVNVLADPAIRQGIKTYSDWPTIPQLYIRGEFVGGSDIVKQLYGSGELHSQLGVEVEEVAPPAVAMTAAAAAVLTKAAAEETTPTLRMQISARFQYGLTFGPEQPGDIAVQAGGLTLLFDRGSAKRADGMTLDFDEQAGGFHINNPNEPAQVQTVSVQQLKAALDSGGVRLFDVRTDDERATAVIAGSVQLVPATRDEALALPKDTPLYFSCHHGGRSMQAAQAFIEAGFQKVYNVEGGIDAWSQHIDPTVPRY